MPVGVVLHYMPCRLVNCHCNQHFTIWVQIKEGWLQVWCYLYRGTIISDMSDNLVPLSDMSSCTMQLLSDMHAGFMNSCTHVVKCSSIKQGIWSVTNPSDMSTFRIPLPKSCKTCRVPSWTPSWIYYILNYVLIASLRCYKDNVCSSKISKINFACRFLKLTSLREDFLIFFVINCHLGGHLVRILSYFSFGYKLSVYN